MEVRDGALTATVTSQKSSRYGVDRRCVKCGEMKPSSDFHRNRRSSDGLHSYCKPCNTARAAAYLKTERGKLTLQRLQDEGYYRFGKGAFPILQQSAARRNLPFDLTAESLDMWWKQTPDVCEYCGITVNDFCALRDAVLTCTSDNWNVNRFKRFFRSDKHAAIQWLTIDRKDNSQGYAVHNLSKACWFCNSLKNDFFSVGEMMQIAPGIIASLKDAVAKDLAAYPRSHPSPARPSAARIIVDF